MTESAAHQGSARRLRILGWLMLVLSLIYIGHQLVLVTRWNHTRATVLSVEKVTSGSGSSRSTSYYPTIRYQDTQGHTHTLRTGYGSGQFNFERGDIIPVIFHPARSTDFRIITFWAFWVWSLLMLGMAALALFLARTGGSLADPRPEGNPPHSG